MIEVGQRLQERRNELNMTQDFVAEKLDITRQTSSNWENGRSYPDIERIIRLSELYTLSLDELLKGDQETVQHLKENTTVNRFLKMFALLPNGLGFIRFSDLCSYLIFWYLTARLFR